MEIIIDISENLESVKSQCFSAYYKFCPDGDARFALMPEFLRIMRDAELSEADKKIRMIDAIGMYSGNNSIIIKELWR